MRTTTSALVTATILCSSAMGETPTTDHQSDKIITKIAFGSCNNPREKDSTVVAAAIKKSPDLFIFLGDNIYGDTEDMDLLKKKYKELGDSNAYKSLQKQCPILATWDDHDYGINDGGNTYKKREQSAEIFLDFFNEPKDSMRRKREGIYGSYLYGKGNKKLQIILLDTRYFRDLIKRAGKKKKEGTVGWYEPTTDTSKTLLGKEQWSWLEQQLQVEADVRIIASSIQMLAFEKGMENWGNVPHEQKRLFDLLKKYKANHTFAISGDVHFTELSKITIPETNYPFYDLTSSGMTHSHKGWSSAVNSFRVGKASAEENVGFIEIDWDKNTVNLSALNKEGRKLVDQTVTLSDLTFE